MATTTASLLRLNSPDPREAAEELRYLFALAARNRGDLFTSSILQSRKRSALGQWATWRARYPDAWIPAFTAIPTLMQAFVSYLAGHTKPARQLAEIIQHDPTARREVVALIALDIYEDHWASYTQQPTCNPFATPAALVFTGWHILLREDRVFQHEAHGHWAKQGLPEHASEPDPPDMESPSALFADTMAAIIGPVAQALRVVFEADTLPILPEAKAQLSLFSEQGGDH